jgi:hypothetical protein
VTFRIDRSGFKRDERGALICTARMSRTGPLVYSTGIETRASEDLLDPDSLSTIVHAPVTVQHAPDPIDVSVWKDLSVGFVTNVSTDNVDGVDWALVDMLITNPDVIEDIESGSLTEVSAGYSTRLVQTQDAALGDVLRQTNIKYNHIALLGYGEARAGRDAKIIRQDSNNMEEELKKLTEMVGQLMERIPTPAPTPHTDAADVNEALIAERVELLSQARELGVQADAKTPSNDIRKAIVQKCDSGAVVSDADLSGYVAALVRMHRNAPPKTEVKTDAAADLIERDHTAPMVEASDAYTNYMRRARGGK